MEGSNSGMDTFHQDSSSVGTRLCTPLDQACWGALFTLVLFNSLSLRQLNLWLTLIKCEIKIQVLVTEFVKLNSEIVLWSLECGKRRVTDSSDPSGGPSRTCPSLFLWSSQLLCPVEETLNNRQRAELLWWGHRGRIWVTKIWNLWEISLH